MPKAVEVSKRVVELAPWQMVSLTQPFEHFAMLTGVACVRGDTLIETENGPIRIDRLQAGTKVWSAGADGLELVACGQPFLKGKKRLFCVVHEGGEFVAHELHLISLASGEYQYVGCLAVGDELCSFSPTRTQTNQELAHGGSPQGVQHLTEKPANYPTDYQGSIHLYDQQPQSSLTTDRNITPQQIDGLKSCYLTSNLDAQETTSKDIHQSVSSDRQPKPDFVCPVVAQQKALAGPALVELPEHILQLHPGQSPELFEKKTSVHRLEIEPLRKSPHFLGAFKVLSVEQLDTEDHYWDVHIPGNNNYLAHGVIHHNCGKTYTGSHFAIQHIQNYPHLTGFIGANTYDQMSQATLREFLYWLDHYQYEFVVDRKPPDSWGLRRAFKQYKNMITVKTPAGCTPIFTRTLAKGNPLRGIEFSWYWLDETRDTPENTHDILLSRMRESTYRKGLITTTTNGYDWCHKRFIQKKGVKNPLTYGSMHVKTSESRDQGLITPEYYDLLRSSYSPMMAAQELDALHVNANSGLAYYAAGEHNRARIAPWGDSYPNPERPLIVGCDFNYQPAPMVWMVGQVGPNLVNDRGELWSEHIHWFDELSGVQVPTNEMAMRLASRYPEFFMEIYGDSSGGQDTTSNAGDNDYNQIGDVLTDNKIMFTIHKDLGFNNPEHRKRNPLVKERVEAMNTLFKSGAGNVRQTYNPDRCPLFDADLTGVGWKTNVKGKGRLDDGGNKQLTHATDGAGYAVYKKFPPQRRAVLIDSVESYALNQLRGGT